jgi:hypothetical protein
MKLKKVVVQQLLWLSQRKAQRALQSQQAEKSSLAMLQQVVKARRLNVIC